MQFPIKRFLSYYKPYFRLYVMVLVCDLVVSAISLVFPLLVRFITKDVLAGDLSTALSQVFRVGGLMLVLAIAQTAGGYFVDFKGHEVGARMERDMRTELFTHLQSLPFSFFDKQRTGHLMSRVTNDLLLLAELYHHGPEDYVRYSIQFAGALTILSFINVRLTFAIFCFLPFLAAYYLYFNRVLNRAMRRNRERIADVNAQVEDSLAGIRVVKSFSNERVEVEKFNRENHRFFDSRKRTYNAEAYFYNGMDTILQFITITVVILGSASIVHQTLDLPDLITFLLYLVFLIEPMQKLTHMTTQFQEGVTGFRRFTEIMDVVPAIVGPPGAIVLSDVRGAIEFHDVSFRYDDHVDHVFTHVSLHIRPGEYVAIVGPSGAGKTTLVSLIPRFYDVVDGGVLVDGVDVRDIDLPCLRNNIGVVQQDVYLFAGTVMENIRYGNPMASEDAIVEAAKFANAHEFIMSLPNGYTTDIGQRGVRLSGGQKQRLCIARVFLKNPPILILDEATSALDNESERIVQRSIEMLAKGRTTLVIAHRLSTIRNAERIVMLTEDGISEQGTHESLLSQNGAYARLYSRQFDISM